MLTCATAQAGNSNSGRQSFFMCSIYKEFNKGQVADLAQGDNEILSLLARGVFVEYQGDARSDDGALACGFVKVVARTAKVAPIVHPHLVGTAQGRSHGEHFRTGTVDAVRIQSTAIGEEWIGKESVLAIRRNDVQVDFGL